MSAEKLEEKALDAAYEQALDLLNFKDSEPTRAAVAEIILTYLSVSSAANPKLSPGDPEYERLVSDVAKATRLAKLPTGERMTDRFDRLDESEAAEFGIVWPQHPHDRLAIVADEFADICSAIWGKAAVEVFSNRNR